MVAAHKDIHFLDRKHILLSIKIPAKLQHNRIVFSSVCHSFNRSFSMFLAQKNKCHERELAPPSSVTKKKQKNSMRRGTQRQVIRGHSGVSLQGGSNCCCSRCNALLRTPAPCWQTCDLLSFQHFNSGSNVLSC